MLQIECEIGLVKSNYFLARLSIHYNEIAGITGKHEIFIKASNPELPASKEQLTFPELRACLL